MDTVTQQGKPEKTITQRFYQSDIFLLEQRKQRLGCTLADALHGLLTGRDFVGKVSGEARDEKQPTKMAGDSLKELDRKVKEAVERIKVYKIPPAPKSILEEAEAMAEKIRKERRMEELIDRTFPKPPAPPSVSAEFHIVLEEIRQRHEIEMKRMEMDLVNLQHSHQIRYFEMEEERDERIKRAELWSSLVDGLSDLASAISTAVISAPKKKRFPFFWR